MNALQESEEKFRTLVEAAPDSIMLVNSEGRILLINTRAEKTFGYAKEELLGMNHDILVPERFREKHASLRYRHRNKARKHGKTLQKI